MAWGEMGLPSLWSSRMIDCARPDSRHEELYMTAQRFQGKVAVVTGGNSGIGLGVAKAYAQQGAQVVITGRNGKTLEAAAKEIGDGTLAVQSDAGKVAEIEAAMQKIKERFGRIDALFVNAGIAKLVPFEQITEELFDETVNTNMKGVFLPSRKRSR